MDIFKFSALTRVRGISTAERARIFLDEEVFDIFISGHLDHLQDKRLSKELAKLDLDQCEAEDREIMKQGAGILAYNDPAFPDVLRHLEDPPPCLYFMGDSAPFKKPAVAVVGSRLASVYGQAAAETIARDLVLNGISVVSGLARGIDSAAHRGSLAVRGAQVAVMGTGIDDCYPKENKGLMDEIIKKGGAIVTEFPPKTPPFKKNFPCRNRIIAGLAWGTLVAEATEYSGSLATARFAVETGRELFAIPHNITSRGGVGPNTLIQKGAKLVARAEDIIDEMPAFLRDKLARCQNGEGDPAIPVEGMTGEEKKVLGILRVDEDRSLDMIIESSGIPVGDILSALSRLKIKGLCKEWPGARYTRTTSERS